MAFAEAICCVTTIHECERAARREVIPLRCYAPHEYMPRRLMLCSVSGSALACDPPRRSEPASLYDVLVGCGSDVVIGEFRERESTTMLAHDDQNCHSRQTHESRTRRDEARTSVVVPRASQPTETDGDVVRGSVMSRRCAMVRHSSGEAVRARGHSFVRCHITGLALTKTATSRVRLATDHSVVEATHRFRESRNS